MSSLKTFSQPSANVFFRGLPAENAFSIEKVLPELASLINQSPQGFPLAMQRAHLIETGSPDAFLPADQLLQKSKMSRQTPTRLLRQLVKTESSAYLTAHVTALETAVSHPTMQVRTSIQTPSSLIRPALEDVKDTVTFAFRDSNAERHPAPVDDNLYRLIHTSPKVILHEHARGGVEAALIRARFIEKAHSKAYVSTADLKEHCRMKRMYTPEGNGPLYRPNLKQHMEKYEEVASAIYSDSTAYLSAYLFTIRAAVENVRYFEYRLNPMSSTVKDPMRFIQSYQQGIEDAKRFVKDSRGLKIDYSLILSADRQPKPGVDLTPKPGEKYDPRVEMGLKILAVAKEARRKGLNVSGFDITGDEEGYAITDFKPVADELKRYNKQMVAAGTPELRIGATLHAGETPYSGKKSNPMKLLSPVESIAMAIRLFWDENTPVRIGHGTYIYLSPQLIKECVKKGIGIEQCPKSNVQTGAVSFYPVLPTMTLLRDHRLLVSLSSDNRRIHKTDSCNELVKLSTYCGAKQTDRKRLQMNGIRTAFIFDPTKKREIEQDMQRTYRRIERSPDFKRFIQEEAVS
jgi:adenosine deaminase